MRDKYVFYSFIILWIPIGLSERPDSMVSLAALSAIVAMYAVSLIAVSYYFLKRRRIAVLEKSAFLAFNICSLFFFLSLSFYFYTEAYLI